MSRAALAATAIGGACSLALLSGCADMEDNMREILGDADNGPRFLAFECEDDREFTVRLSGDRDAARVDTGSREYELEEAGRENGRRVYEDDDDVRLTLGGGEAYLRIPGGDDYRDCEEM